jgi:TorA maturation chaperone TorD
MSASVLSDDQMKRFVMAADAVDLIVRLHDREPDAEFITGLKANPLSDWFSVFMPVQTPQQFDQAISSLPDPLPQEVLDDLAAEYADIFLTHGYRASPNGSVWLTEDRIERQEPMFEARSWYDHYYVKVPDWRIRADDHLVHELQFVSHLLRLGSDTAAADAARFMDKNLLPWLSQFAGQVLKLCRHRYFAGSMELTVASMESIRDLLEDICGVARPVPVDETALPKRAQVPFEQPYFPGASESW